jgi:cysteine desulfurase/selenocysteine lyase
VGPRTKLIAVTHMSNVTGTIVDVGAIARGTDVPVLVDGSQAAVHMPVDLAALGIDFYCITGHKLYGPSGSGAMWIRRERQAEMRPFMGGGDMIRTVTREAVDYADPPLRFEAGTPGIVNQIGLGAALEYLMDLGMEDIAAHERSLRDYARDRLRSLNWLQVQGDAPGKGAIFSMTMQGAHAHDLSTILDKRGIAVRAGSHCAMPLMEFFGITASARASFAMYNTKQEVDALVEGLSFCGELFA